MKRLFKKLQNIASEFTTRPYARGVVFVLALAGLSVFALQFSSAATPIASIEAESGTKTCVTTTTDTTASGGSAIQFASSTGCSDPLASLSRIPWEGGPAYYAQFPKAAAAGWSSPSFFPIANFATPVQKQADADNDKSIGLNTYVNQCCKEFPAQQMTWIRNAGMFAIAGEEWAPYAGSETVGWDLIDEPSQFCDGQPVTCTNQKIKESYDAINTASPNDGRFKFTNFTNDMVLPNNIRPTAQAELNTYNDVVSADNYWYTFGFMCGGSAGGEIWHYGSGGAQPFGNGFPNLSDPECRRSANYGYSMDSIRGISKGNLAAPKVATWAFVENSHPSDNASEPSIQPGQLSGAVMSSVIHEARGIIYFNRNFAPSGASATIDPCGGSEPFRGCNNAYGAAIKADATKVNNLLKQLAPVINTQSYQYTFDATLQTMLKQQGGSIYIFAMPGDKKGGAYTGNHTLQLPPGVNASSVEVVNESRALPITAGSFTDTFAQEYTYHIYKITP